MASKDIPVFLAYRRIDGEPYARLVHDNLEKVEIGESRLDVFCDLYTPAADDFTKYNVPALRRARALILIVTPGAMASTGRHDWLYKEIDWWIENRPGVAPIVLNTVPDALDRFFPAQIKKSWRTLNWLPLDLEEASNEESGVFRRTAEGICLGLPDWAKSEEERQQEQLESERRHRRTLGFYLAGTLLALLLALVVGAVAGAQYRELQVKNRKLGIAELNERSAKEDAMEMLNLAEEGLARGLVHEGRLLAEYDPGGALRLAELAASLTSSVVPASLFRNAMIQHPVWSRIGPPGRDGSARALFPDAPRQSDVFAVNKDISVVLLAAQAPQRVGWATLQSPMDDFLPADTITAEPPLLDWDRTGRITLEARDVPSGRCIGTLTLREKEWFVAPDPSATELFVTRMDSETEKQGWSARIYELSGDGLAGPLVEMTGVRDLALSDGGWPCFVLFTDGTLTQYISPQNQRTLGKWPSLRVAAHPDGTAAALSAGAGLVWVGLAQSTPTVVSVPWEPMTDQGVMMATAIRWGPDAHHVLAYRIKAIDEGEEARLATSLTAFNMKSQHSQELLAEPIRANKFTRLICETSRDGSRVVTTTFEPSPAKRIIETRGGLPLALTLKWLSDDDDAVVELRLLPDSALRGEQQPATKVSFRCAAVSPNGKYVVVGNDMRTSSGTGSGTGVVESWDLASLDSDSSASTEARRFYFGVSTVQRIAYSSNGSRVAIWDHEGTAHFFRVATESPGPFATHRLPKEDVERLDPKVHTLGVQGRYWFVDFGRRDAHILDLGKRDTGGIGVRVDLEGAALDLAEIDDHRVIVISESEIRLLGVGLERSIRLGVPGKSACAGPEVTAVLNSQFLTLYNSATLDQLVSVDINGLAAAFRTILPKLVSAHFDNRSQRSICRWHREKNGFSVLSDDGDEIGLWRLQVDGDGEYHVRRTEVFQLDTDRQWHSIRRTSDGSRVVLLSGDNGGDQPELLQCSTVYADGARITLESPKGGWPVKLMEVADMKTLESGELAILFLFVNEGDFNVDTMETISPFFQGFGIAVFPKAGGACTWHDFGNPEFGYGELVAVDWNEPVNKTLILIKTAEQALLLRSPGGQVVLSEPIASSLLDAPPFLQHNDSGAWEAQNRSTYNKTLQFLLMGGGRLSHVTHVRMPTEREVEVATLVEHRRRIERERDLGVEGTAELASPPPAGADSEVGRRTRRD